MSKFDKIVQRTAEAKAKQEADEKVRLSTLQHAEQERQTARQKFVDEQDRPAP